jgi:hypothetical protein
MNFETMLAYAFLGTGSEAFEPNVNVSVFFVPEPPPVEHAASNGIVAAPMAPARRTRLSTVVFAILRNALTVSVGIVLLLLRNSNGQGNSRKNTSGVYIKSQIRTKLSIITHHDLASAPPGMGPNAAFFHDFARYFQSKVFTGAIGFEHFRALW